jgi:hypothetical protein
MTNANDMIRMIAKKLVGEGASDEQITAMAARMGCRCPVTGDLGTLDMLERVRLLKFMINQGKAAGMSLEMMAR